MTPVLLKRKAKIGASVSTSLRTILTEWVARKTAEEYLIKLGNESDKELRHRAALSWPRLQNAYRILGMPHSKNNAAFIKFWRAKKSCYPFYERYMIKSGRAKEIITNEALAKKMNLNAADRWDLRLYRHALRDPAIATNIRKQMREEWKRASVTKRLLYFMRWTNRSVYVLVFLVLAWLGLAIAVYLRLLNYYVTVGALLGGFVLVVALL
ncbi:MAG: hypothetical protein Q9221_002067 [Calogaya cf. arnoldii]